MSTSPSEAKCGVSAVSDPDACDITVNLTAVSCVGRYPGCKALGRHKLQQPWDLVDEV